MDDTRRLRLSIALVELPDGVHFEQYVLRMPKTAMTVLLDAARKQVLMIWRHRFVFDCWTWELPGGYVDPDEVPALTAAREVEEETGWWKWAHAFLTIAPARTTAPSNRIDERAPNGANQARPVAT
ncbi:MAG: NUDIX hydrolase [Pseudonocardiaceae bacterium]